MRRMAPEYKRADSHGRYTTLHRAIYERHHGVKLPRSVHVHHINGDKRDNRIENLEAIPATVHGAMHSPTFLPVVKLCAVCGGEFRPHKTKRRRQQTCGERCRSVLMTRHSTSAKLTPATRVEAMCRYLSGQSQADIARHFGVSQSAILALRKKPPAVACVFAQAIAGQLAADAATSEAEAA